MKEPRPILKLKLKKTETKKPETTDEQISVAKTESKPKESLQSDNPKIAEPNQEPEGKSEKPEQKNDKPMKSKKKLLMPKEEYQEHLKYLQIKYPKCFTTPPSPLAIEIKAELIEKEEGSLSNTKIRNVLRIYANSKSYKNSLILGVDRVNLDGSIHSQVTQAHIDIDRTKRPKKKPKNTPHDGLVKKVMENSVAAQEFLEKYLPESFKKLIDLTTVEIDKESFVEPDLVRRSSDVVLSVKTKNNEQAFIYTLIEAVRHEVAHYKVRNMRLGCI